MRLKLKQIVMDFLNWYSIYVKVNHNLKQLFYNFMELKENANSDMNCENCSETDVGSDSYFKSLEKQSDEQEDTKNDLDEEANSE